jgi:hypothetical protein
MLSALEKACLEIGRLLEKTPELNSKAWLAVLLKQIIGWGESAIQSLSLGSPYDATQVGAELVKITNDVHLSRLRLAALTSWTV